MYKEPMVHSIYNLPDMKMTRSAKLGNTARNLWVNLDKSPSPDRYQIRSSLELNLKKNRGVKLVPKIEIQVKYKFIKSHLLH
jgi:hypothetical protein